MTDRKEEWGPWIDVGPEVFESPRLGDFVQLRGKSRHGYQEDDCTWGSDEAEKLSRIKTFLAPPLWLQFRIRKPRALSQLQDIAANPERELETT